jgi:acyl-coenzyme A thioesterase PaaI-like protein
MTSDQTPAESGPTPDLTVEQLNAVNADTLLGLLGIRVMEASAERVVMTMPVTNATRQALGLLHGGATVTLAESAATIGTYLGIDPAAFLPVAIEINCKPPAL